MNRLQLACCLLSLVAAMSHSAAAGVHIHRHHAPRRHVLLGPVVHPPLIYRSVSPSRVYIAPRVIAPPTQIRYIPVPVNVIPRPSADESQINIPPAPDETLLDERADEAKRSYDEAREASSDAAKTAGHSSDAESRAVGKITN